MTSIFLSPLRRFRKQEDGSMVVPFAIWIPLFITLILASVEIGTITVRTTVLERSMEGVVRDIRLGRVSTAEEIKTAICDNATVLPNCTSTLHLEMVALDMRDWTGMVEEPDCTDTTLEITPNRTFQNGNSNEMVLLRACYKYRPLTPAGSIGSHMAKDSAGYSALVVTSAFVNEPT